MARHRINHRRLVRLADHDDAIHPARTRHAIEPRAIGGDHAAEQQIIAALGQLVGQQAQHGDEEGLGNVLALFMPQRDQHADRPGALDAQVARQQVGPKAVFARQRLNTLARFLADQFRTGQRPADRAGGDTGQFGQLFDVADLVHAAKDACPYL
jgi:hypothetical protein